MSRDLDRFHKSGIAAQAERIRASISCFDDATHAAADSIRDAELRLVEGTLAQADAEATFDAAIAVAPYAPGILGLLAVLDGVPVEMRSALPELVNDTSIARILAALRFIGDELDNYLADSDTTHLATALGTGLQRLHQALRRSLGYWQMGQDEGRWPPVVADLDLGPERRDRLARKLLAALQGWVPGSAARLRGSLAAGTADGYSDIDICWVVPDQDFTDAVDTAAAALSQVAAVMSVRADPDCARSARRRVIFARLWGVPLFWRIDIDIRASTVAADDLYDAGNPDTRSNAGWSAAASAIENAIAALKAVARGRPGPADDLLRRGCERIGHGFRSATDPADAICDLADACAAHEPPLTRLAAETRQVADHLLRSDRPGNGSAA